MCGHGERQRSVIKFWSVIEQMMRLLVIATFFFINSGSFSCGDELTCIIAGDENKPKQLWAIPNRPELNVQKDSEHRVPVTYIDDLRIIVQPPKNVRIRTLSIGEIAKLTSLVTLDLSGTTTDTGDLQELVTLENLEVLVLDNTMIDDSSLEHFEKFNHLKIISIHDCQIPNEAELGKHFKLPVICTRGSGQTVIPLLDIEN